MAYQVSFLRSTGRWSGPACSIKKDLIRCPAGYCAAMSREGRRSVRGLKSGWRDLIGPCAASRSCAKEHSGWFSSPLIDCCAINCRAVDETSVKTNMTRLCGRSAIGERLFGVAPFGRWQTQTSIAGLTCGALIAPWVIGGAMDRAIFDICVEPQVALAPAPCTVVILDNPSTHKSSQAAETLKDHGR